MQTVSGTYDYDRSRRACLQTGWFRSSSRPRGERSHGHLGAKKLRFGHRVRAAKKRNPSDGAGSCLKGTMAAPLNCVNS